MGLLSNPSAPPLNGPLRKPQMLAIPFYVISILWMIALANRQLNSDTYFSENALLPGLVNCHYREESLAQRYLLLIQVNIPCKLFSFKKLIKQWFLGGG